MNLLSRAVSLFRRKQVGALTPISGSHGGWWPVVRESFAGAWQRNIEIRQDLVLANWAVYSCITLIASDIGKLRLQLVENVDGIWQETDSPAFSPVLRKPNRYQTRQKFIEQWIVSKLTNGNAYVLKERDQRGVVVALYVLDPCSVKPLVALDGSIYYQLAGDDLSNVPDDLPAVPASEIIHDTMVCLFHPLVGISPIYACGLAATQGLKIQNNSALFFQNMSRPSGVLTAPAQISDVTAKRLKDHWEENYTGGNVGKVAVLGDGLKYEAMTINAVDAQMVEQLKMTAEMVCSTFHVPAFKIGAGTIPAGQKVEDLNQIYYTDCLQALIESAEALLDYGLGLDTPKEGKQLGTEFNLDDLLKMDSATMTLVLRDQVGAGITKPNEARKRLNMGPATGGDTPYLQQQNFSLAALAKRDDSPDPFGTAKPEPAPAAPPSDPPADMKALERVAEGISEKQGQLFAGFEAKLAAIEESDKARRAEDDARRVRESAAREAERIADQQARAERAAAEAEYRARAESERLADERKALQVRLDAVAARADAALEAAAAEAAERKRAEAARQAEMAERTASDEKVRSFLGAFKAMCEAET